MSEVDQKTKLAVELRRVLRANAVDPKVELDAVLALLSVIFSEFVADRDFPRTLEVVSFKLREMRGKLDHDLAETLN